MAFYDFIHSFAMLQSGAKGSEVELFWGGLIKINSGERKIQIADIKCSTKKTY